jgi:hypothetical protein
MFSSSSRMLKGNIDVYHSHEVFLEGIIPGINKVKLITVPDINGTGFSIAIQPPHYLLFF